MFIDVYWSLLMFIDVYWCLLMSIDVYSCLLMFIDVYWWSLMFTTIGICVYQPVQKRGWGRGIFWVQSVCGMMVNKKRWPILCVTWETIFKPFSVQQSKTGHHTAIASDASEKNSSVATYVCVIWAMCTVQQVLVQKHLHCSQRFDEIPCSFGM